MSLAPAPSRGDAGLPAPYGPTGLPLLSALDVAVGWPLGTVPTPKPPPDADPDPVRALRAALRPALLRPPCVVAFSGGRDSSLLLAVAADLAAREGLRPPVALTFRYPGDPMADESAWQDLMIEHLRSRGTPPEWVRVDVADELDNIGPLVAPVLRAHGAPTFPAGLGNTVLQAAHAAGGSLVTGNGGDEVLADHRTGVLRAAARRRGRGMSAEDWRLVASCALPDRVVARLPANRPQATSWLRPDTRAAALRTVPPVPLRWDRAVRDAARPRAAQVSARTRDLVCQERDCRLVEPLGSPGFVAAYAAFGGRWAGLTRTGGIRLLADGLLPEVVIRRVQKAAFNASRFGRESRTFALRWDGRGVDGTLVDPDGLRAAWLSELPPAGTGLLLQQAWLAAGGGRQ